jgi:hypothetical protein
MHIEHVGQVQKEKSTVTITLQKNVASDAETMYLSESSELNPGV